MTYSKQELQRLADIARGAIERHLGVAVEDGPDQLYDSAFVLAFDALRDAGVEVAVCRQIAGEQARLIAQP